VNTGRLLELYLLYFEKLSQEVIDPKFKSSSQIEEEKIDRFILEDLTTPEAPEAALKVG